MAYAPLTAKPANLQQHAAGPRTAGRRDAPAGSLGSLLHPDAGFDARPAFSLSAVPVDAPAGAPPPASLRVQRRAAPSERNPGIAPGSVAATLRQAGRPLERTVRRDMERAFGADLSRVRIHDNSAARASTRDVGAEAYTVGRNIVFGPGRYAPHTAGGKRLLAHELAHTLQQRNVAPPVSASGSTPLRVTAPNDLHEIQADRIANRVSRDVDRSPAPPAGSRSVEASPAAVMAVQRQKVPGEESPKQLPGRHPDLPPRKSAEEAPGIMMIVAYSGSKSSAVATLSDGTVEPIEITANTLEAGDYTFERDRSATLQYRLVGRREGQIFVWMKKRAYRWADTVRVFIRRSPQERIAALPTHIRNFLTTSRPYAPKASATDLVSIASAGRILETYGVTEDELSLLELAEADRRGVGSSAQGSEAEGGDPVGWALAFVEGRQEAAARADKTRDVLRQSAAQLGSAWRWRENPAAAAFEQALEVEVRAAATSILNATEAAIYRMDRFFIGAYQPEGLGFGFLSDQLDLLRADPEIQKARKSLQVEEDWEPPRQPTPEEKRKQDEQAEYYYKAGVSSAIPEPWYSPVHAQRHAIRLSMYRERLNELVSVKTGARLQLGSLPRADAERLLGAKTGSGAQGVLRDMLHDGRTAVRDARRRLDDAKALFGADIVIATEKALLGVSPGSTLDQIIDDIVRDRTAPSIWDRIVDIVSLVAMFIPGGIGIAIRAALSTVQSVRSVERFSGQATFNRAGLSSVDPSGGALVAELIVTAGGVVLDKATAAKVAGRGKLLDLGERAPAASHVPSRIGSPPDAPVSSVHAPGGEPPTEMRGVQLADEAHSIQIRPAQVPAPASAAELAALRNTEISVLGRRGDLARDLDRLRIERGGLDGTGGLRSQIAKRDRLLEGDTLSQAGKDNVRREIKDLEKQLDAKDAQIAKLEADLAGANDELAYVRGRLGKEGATAGGQPTQLAAGRLRESEVGEAFNLGPKNNQLMQDPNPGGADFIPDFVNGNPASLTWGKPYHFREVKDWADMSDTGNLSAMLDYVSNFTGSRLTIYYRSNTYMSGPLTTRIEALFRSGRVDLVPFAGE